MKKLVCMNESGGLEIWSTPDNPAFYEIEIDDGDIRYVCIFHQMYKRFGDPDPWDDGRVVLGEL